jgi:3'(2'), 5'-bisphosphate nucleotidase
MLNSETETAIRLAREAGAAILEIYTNGFQIEEKRVFESYSEPVTIADREANEIICNELRRKFPEDHILSEEETDDANSRLAHKRVWMIDPLDGTQGFVRKDDDFAVQIGLAENGVPVLGVVFLPIQKQLFFASKNSGALFVEENETPRQIFVSEKSDFAEINMAVSRQHKSPKLNLIADRLGIRLQTSRGSVGLKIGLVATRICDLYMHLGNRTKFWDTCAPQIILEEAGGKLTDIFGTKIDYETIDVQNHNGILAANATLHETILKEIQPLLTEIGRSRVVNVT